ncbi:hypothetical protein EZY14_002925 [Kordia sp. TARA_039_SRF]|nr:hypothetical protein EZY14_002925 [Kordia sp. TARA_039_SRF]
MKLVCAHILAIILLFNSVKGSLAYGWYVLDIDSFIEQLCENKDTPELECNGKCYLTKLSQNSSSEDGQTIPAIEWEQLVYCQTEIFTPYKTITIQPIRSTFYYFISNSEAHIHSIFHPPKIS